MSGAMTTSTDTSCTVVRARLLLLNCANDARSGDRDREGRCTLGSAVGVVWPLPLSCALLTSESSMTLSRKSYRPVNPKLTLTFQPMTVTNLPRYQNGRSILENVDAQITHGLFLKHI
jgi:hypothetical protein